MVSECLPRVATYLCRWMPAGARLDSLLALTRLREGDVLTFTGYGRWSKDPTARSHQVSAQIVTGAEEYVSIQIDSGLVSNVNTRPADEEAALP